jgi:hypothetical protein
MHRRTAHFAAAVAAAAVAAAQLAGLDMLMDTTRSPADSLVVLPRVVVTPSGSSRFGGRCRTSGEPVTG